jgi:hypothetical protein
MVWDEIRPGKGIQKLLLLQYLPALFTREKRLKQFSRRFVAAKCTPENQQMASTDNDMPSLLSSFCCL